MIDSRDEVAGIAETKGAMADELDLVVHAFDGAVGDAGVGPSEDAVEVGIDQPGKIPERLEPGAPGGVEPAAQVGLGASGLAVVPEELEGLFEVIGADDGEVPVRAGEKLDQERRESGGPWRSKNRPPEIGLRKRPQEERFVRYRRDVHSGDLCTSTASSSGRGEKRAAGSPGVWAGAGDRSEDVAVCSAAGLPAATTGEAAEAGSVGGSD